MTTARLPLRGRPGLAIVLSLAVVAATVFLFVGTVASGDFDAGLVELVADALWLLMLVALAVAALLIILQREDNLVGWILMVWGVAIAAAGLTNLAVVNMPVAPDQLGFGQWLLLWFHNWAVLLIVFPIFHLFLVFPSGRLLGRRWRWLVGLELALLGLQMAVNAFAEQIGPQTVWGGDVPDWTIANPIGWRPLAGAEWLWPVWIAGLFTLIVGSGVAVIVRYRRASPVERQQLKWFLYAMAVSVLGFLLGSGLQGGDDALGDLILILGLLSVPTAITLAVLRFRLYDIDTVISRTLVWVSLTVVMAVLYVAVVAATGIYVGIALAAIAFQPVRRWLQRAAHRIVYGRRATPYEVLSELTRTLTSVESTKGVLDRTARRLGEATAAENATVWIVDGDRLHPVGTWPADAEHPRAVGWDRLPGEVTLIGPEGRPLGALTVEKRRGDPVTPTERRLIEDLAGSSASVLHNAALQEELRERAADLAASRRRLMEVQDSERHRMERELDEGAQQLVVSLKVKLNVAARLARADGAEGLADLLDGMDQEARDAITQIRSLARGLYPPLLEAEGLETAVRALVEMSPIPVQLAVDLGEDRLPLELEAAIFFCISEALTNATKYAGEGSVSVVVSRTETAVAFEIADDGPGFESAAAAGGSGLRNMADRLDAIGGALAVEASAGHGTTVRGRVPLTVPVAAGHESSTQCPDSVSGSRSDLETKPTAPAASAASSNSAAS